MKYSDVDVLNFIEGNFSDKQVADILAQKRIDPELANTIDAMQASLLPYKEAYGAQSLPKMPESLATKLRSTATTQPSNSVQSSPDRLNTSVPYIPYMWVASFLIAGIGIGFFVASSILSPSVSPDDQSPGGQSFTSTSTELQRQHTTWVTRVADYQSLYVENTVKSIPVSAHTDAINLLNSLSARQELTVSIPDLTPYGYEFVRAQELGFEGATLLQLVYRKPGSIPLAYCLMPNGFKHDLPLQLSQQHQLGVASWVSGNQHHVLVADESTSTLQKIHNTILEI